MNDTIPVVPPDAALAKMKAIAGEHFDHYLIVTMDKNGIVFHTYNNKVSGFGMASMVASEINQNWWNKS